MQRCVSFPRIYTFALHERGKERDEFRQEKIDFKTTEKHAYTNVHFLFMNIYVFFA